MTKSVPTEASASKLVQYLLEKGLGGFPPLSSAANLADEAQSWVLRPDGSYQRDLKPQDGNLFNCHRFFMENPSLSGRGTAGAKDVPRLAQPRDEGAAP